MGKLAFGIGAMAAALAAACSSSSGSGGPSADQACADYAAALCNKINSCSAFLVQVLYPDVASCQSRLQAECASALAAKGTGASPGDAEACAQAYSPLACNDAFARKTPSACRKAGSVANGGACGDDNQCA